jgi:translation initiation factor IF-3
MQNKLINQQIRENSMLVIDEDGQKLGILSRNEALREAEKRGYDLVLIVPSNQSKNNQAIAKITDYGKMLYEQKVKERLSKKNQTITKVKEIKVRPQIAENDLR